MGHAKRHSKVLPMSSDLDDLLRRDEEDDSQVGPAVQPKPPLTRPSMTDALQMMGNLPDAPAVPSDDQLDDEDLIEQQAEVTVDGR